eukprot:1576218-Prymnesium_polylepis.1
MLAHGDDAAMPDAPPDDDLLMADANDSPPPVEVLLQCIAQSRARALAGFIAAELACVRLEFEERDYTLPYVSPRGLFAEAPCERIITIKGNTTAIVAEGTVVMTHEFG